jgi:hypothetical protein
MSFQNPSNCKTLHLPIRRTKRFPLFQGALYFKFNLEEKMKKGGTRVGKGIEINP